MINSARSYRRPEHGEFGNRIVALHPHLATHLADPLARGQQTVKRKGKETRFDFVVVWTNNYRNGTKVFATTLGHNDQTVSDPRYLDLVTRGLLWSCGKLNDDYLKPVVRK